MNVLVVSSVVGKTPSEITYSFVFDEIIRIAKRGFEAYVARSKQEGCSCSYGIFPTIQFSLNRNFLHTYERELY